MAALACRGRRTREAARRRSSLVVRTIPTFYNQRNIPLDAFSLWSRSSFLEHKVNMQLRGVGTTATFGGIPNRRRSNRFPLSEELKYRLIQSRKPMTIRSGRTLNFASKGILFGTEEQLPLGHLVELAVNWPAFLRGTCPMKFVATGWVVRSEPNLAAIRVERYELKTRGGGGLIPD